MEPPKSMEYYTKGELLEFHRVLINMSDKVMKNPTSRTVNPSEQHNCHAGLDVNT